MRLVICLLCLSLGASVNGLTRDKCKAISLSESRGYKVETHTVETRDHNLLTLHRLVNPRVPANRLRRPFILFHGILGSSGGFVANLPRHAKADYVDIDNEPVLNTIYNSFDGKDQSKNEPHSPNNDDYQKERMTHAYEQIVISGTKLSLTSGSLAFTMSNFGYDVWMANLRGNYYSNKHSQGFDHHTIEYWDFDGDTVVENDLTAIFDHVHATTKSQQVGVVSYSFSSMLIMRLLNKYRDRAQNIQPIIMMAPTLFTNSRDVKQRFLIKSMSKYVLPKEGPYPSPKRGILKMLCTMKIASKFCFLLNGLMNSASNKGHSSQLLVDDSNCGRTSLSMLRYVTDNLSTTAIHPKFHVSQALKIRLRNGQHMNKTVIVVHATDDNVSTPDEVKRIEDLPLKDMVLLDYRIDGAFGHHDFLFDPRNEKLVNIPILRMAIAYDRINRGT